MIVVPDASVILKWLLNDPGREPDTQRAAALLRDVVDGRCEVLLPPHWLAEVAGVLVRERPRDAVALVERLRAMEFRVDDDPATYATACRLAVAARQHVFDTLYHAVALNAVQASLVTSDLRYLRAARRFGRIVALEDWHRPT